jgi:hypothetical protein
MTDLETLHVIYNQLTEQQTMWSQIFGTLAVPNLKNLRVNSHSGIDFLQAFSPDARVQRAGQSELQSVPLTFASLQELKIEGWRFVEVLDRDGTLRTCLDLLRICLEDRQKHQAAIKELFLTDCYRITEDDCRNL